MLLDRRYLLRSLVIGAPAIVASHNLMKLRGVLLPNPLFTVADWRTRFGELLIDPRIYEIMFGPGDIKWPQLYGGLSFMRREEEQGRES